MFPTPKRRHDLVFWFSPHTRGCSHNIVCSRTHRLVFPAYAGMFRKSKPSWGEVGCFPRIRGDVPAEQVADQLQSGFSPHTRGCSGATWPDVLIPWVFPAYAGMFPLSGQITVERNMFSPHTRGCSQRAHQESVLAKVFPAYAGMFRSA